ncbi:protein phosphatase 1 regulatory subunit 36-like isoform X2 [Rhinoderma darwinii]|uniref:protein phosphatase 1 regulatory subunit 36-like isoform X2 n=1 Tax=Rhinoderma darwinii TaxID=43563 RepID=UPI003F666551
MGSFYLNNFLIFLQTFGSMPLKKLIRKLCPEGFLWNDEKKALEFSRYSNVQMKKMPPLSSSKFMGSKETLMTVKSVRLQEKPSDRYSNVQLSKLPPLSSNSSSSSSSKLMGPKQTLMTGKSVPLEETPSGRWGPGDKSPEKTLPLKRKPELENLKDVKRMALTLMEEQERLCFTCDFASVFGSKELDDFLVAVNYYMYCFLMKQSQDKRPKSLLPRRPPEKLAEKSDLEKRSEAALRHLTVRYSALNIGQEIKEQHHMAFEKSKASATRRLRRFFECLYSFSVKVAWVTLKRKKLESIEKELHRIFWTVLSHTKLEPMRNLFEYRKKTTPSAEESLGITGAPSRMFNLQDLTTKKPGWKKKISENRT